MVLLGVLAIHHGTTSCGTNTCTNSIGQVEVTSACLNNLIYTTRDSTGFISGYLVSWTRGELRNT
jgi:hypothetical protein